MKGIKKAAFGFNTYRILEYSFRQNTEEDSKVTLQFDPAGEFDPSTGRFRLYFNFNAFNKTEELPLISAKMEAIFEFTAVNTLEELPDYFFLNSIAIVFPYMRSFISTMTLQSNGDVMILDLLNMTSLKEVLQEKTIVSHWDVASNNE